MLFLCDSFCLFYGVVKINPKQTTILKTITDYRSFLNMATKAQRVKRTVMSCNHDSYITAESF
jgi:hypothetical protein